MKNPLARGIGEARRDVGAALLCDARSRTESSQFRRRGLASAGIDNYGRVRVAPENRSIASPDARVGHDDDAVVVEWAAAAASSENGRDKKGERNPRMTTTLHGARNVLRFDLKWQTVSLRFRVSLLSCAPLVIGRVNIGPVGIRPDDGCAARRAPRIGERGEERRPLPWSRRCS